MNKAERLALKWLETVRRLLVFAGSVAERAADAREAVGGLRSSSVVGGCGTGRDVADVVVAMDEIAKSAADTLAEVEAMLEDARMHAMLVPEPLREVVDARWFSVHGWRVVGDIVGAGGGSVSEIFGVRDDRARGALMREAVAAVAETVPESYMLAFMEDSSRLLKS